MQKLRSEFTILLEPKKRAKQQKKYKQDKNTTLGKRNADY